MLTALWTRGRLTALRTVLACALALCTGAGLAQAGTTAPTIDGNGDDLIAFSAALGGASCGLDFEDPRDDISISDPKIVVCATKEDTDGNAVTDYFINGFDVRRFAFAYDRPNRTAYVLWRTEGMIGDTDGNLNPDNNLCPPTNPTFADEPGIGSQENYQVRIDTNCDGVVDIIISVGGVLGSDEVRVQGATFNGSQVAYRSGPGTGRDLELRISNLDLPPVYLVRGNANASFDGLGEDITIQDGCDPKPSIDLAKSVSAEVICPGGTADFTLVVTNNGTVDLTNVTVVDNLPAGLVYQSTQSNTCGGAVNAVGSTITYGPFNLAAGASCTIVLRVGRTAECSGQQTNNASVEGTFQSACFNGGAAAVVSDKASASILCGNVTCSISAPDTRVCPGETVQICGPEGSFTYAWSTGATTRCITVGAGTYSLVVTDIKSGCASSNQCSVTITEEPRPVCSISAPDTRVCPGETVQICGPEGNYSYAWSTGATTRCINVGAGTYSLVITDLTTGCVSNNSCSVTITEDPRPTCSISAPDTRVCPGETVQICGPEGNYSYAWSTGATTRCITVGAGTYSLVITDLTTGCVSNNSCSVTVTEDPRPVCSISAPDTDVCPGETVEICGPAGNYSYAWSTGATTRCITVGAGTYSLVITDLTTGCVSNNSCSVTIVEAPRPVCSISAPDTRVCPGETVQICGPEGNYSYAWSTGATTRCINVGAGTYSLVITTPGGCVSNNSCTVTITEDPRPVCSISAPDTRVCPGETVEICGPAGNYSYAWSTGATTRCINVGLGTYSLVITDLTTGCVSNNSCSVTITEDERPICSISAPDTRVCPGETVEICGPEGPYTYAWNTGATTRCITVGAGTYSLVITSAAGCVSNNSCAVTVTESPRPICSITGDLQVCPNETTELCGPSGSYSYLWNTGAVTRCITVGPGTYSLVITDGITGCVSNNSCSATVVEQGSLPCVEVIVNAPETACVGTQIQICGTVRNCGTGTETIAVHLGDQSLPPFENVGPGQTREYCFTRSMPACSGGSSVQWLVRAIATTSCGQIERTGTDATACSQPVIDVEKTAESEVTDGELIHYEITVRNPSATVGLDNITVTDQLCSFVRYKNNATPTPTSQPAIDAQGGTIVWNIPSLAPGASVVLRFEAQGWLAGANVACPAEVICTNHVAVVGYCAGSGTSGTPARDEDSVDTKIVCVVLNCPRTVGFWGAQCAQRGNGSTKFDRSEMDQITACIDATSSFFNWSNDFEGFCSNIASGQMDQRKQAKRQYAGMLANLCTGQLGLVPSNGNDLFLDPNTPINCGGFSADTVGELIPEIDALLAELEGQPLSGSVKTRYTQIIGCTGALNEGTSIQTTPGCEHGGISSGSTTGGSEESSVDVYGLELYRAFPNPFTTATQFAFEVEQEAGANVEVTVYDVAGRQIRKLVSGLQPAGRQIATWDGRSDAGVTVTRGVYFVRTVIDGSQAPVQRVLFVR